MVRPMPWTSSASAIRALYYLPYRASLKGEYRWYSDTWGIQAWNVELGYIHPLPKGLTLDVKYRYYDQTAADFYSDLFDRPDQQNFLARDKELSTMTTHTIGAGVSYEFDASFMPGIDRGELNLFVDYILFDYADFRDVSADPTLAPGEEPFFSFESTVVRAYLSFWF